MESGYQYFIHVYEIEVLTAISYLTNYAASDIYFYS